MTNNEKTVTFLTDKQWSIIDGEYCRLTEFIPLVGYVENGEVKSTDSRTPYGTITIECKKNPQKITGCITHKLEFLNLWRALKERELKPNEEVIIVWSKKNYKSILAKLTSIAQPKLRIVICSDSIWDIMVTKNWDSDAMENMMYGLNVGEWKVNL